MTNTNTKIEWTDVTWSPVTGCTKVSSGCKNCYAESIAQRFWGDRKFTDVRTHEDRLDAPMRWRKPQRVFVNSMSDLFHDDVPDVFITEVFDVMEQASRHTFQVLTKRPERMRDFVAQREADRCDYAAKFARCPTEAMRNSPAAKWARERAANPPRNIWLGVSVEDQHAADERIPLLLQTPAAVRFLSCEPLLGPVDLAGWGAAKVASDFPAAQPETWDGYPWPEWVPAEQRQQIEKFWSVRDGRGPRGWIENQRTNRMPASGARVGVTLANGGWGTVVPALSPLAVKRGRWLHSWNNVGRVIADDGETIYSSAGFGPGWLSKWLQVDGNYRHRLHWVITGGESGPGARPCDVAWIRSIVEQCKAAKVPVLVKQLGRGANLHTDVGRGRHVFDRTTGETWVVRDPKGGDISEFPSDLQVREFPDVG